MKKIHHKAIKNKVRVRMLKNTSKDRKSPKDKSPSQKQNLSTKLKSKFLLKSSTIKK